MANKLKRIAIGLMALSMRLDAYAIQRGMTMDAAHPKDPDPKNWRTINGSKVHLTEGKIDGGAGGKFTGKEWTGKTKHEFTTKEKPKQEETKATAKPKAKKTAPAYVPKKMDEHAYTNLSSKCQQDIDDLASLAAYKKTTTDFDDPVLDFLKGKIKQKNNLDDKEMQGVKHAYEELQNGEIDKTTFKNAVASIAYYGVHVPSSPKPPAVPQSVTKPQAKKVETGAFEQISSSKQKSNISFLATYGALGGDVSAVPEVKSIQKYYGLGNVEVAAIKNVYEELKNKKISKEAFKDTVASIIQYGAVGGIPQPKAMKLGELQTKGLAKTKLTKATTGISTPKGTLGLYAAENESVIDPAFKNFEDQYGSVQTAKYTKQEKKSVLRYTQGSKHLRDYLCYGKVEGFGEYTKEALQEKVDNISAGLAKMDHPDMWVCRKCTLMDWATKNNPNGATFEDLKKMKKDGEVFTNAAFLSSTPVDGGTYGDKELIRHFFVPKKAKGGYIKSVSSYADENEFLLDKGTKTRIMKVEKKDGKIITYEEVVLDDE